MDASKIIFWATRMERNQKALAWLEEHGGKFDGRDGNAKVTVAELRLAGGCAGASEALDVINSYATLSIPSLIGSAIESCRNTIQIDAQCIRDEIEEADLHPSYATAGS
jgi:hypothetical protein